MCVCLCVKGGLPVGMHLVQLNSLKFIVITFYFSTTQGASERLLCTTNSMFDDTTSTKLMHEEKQARGALNECLKYHVSILNSFVTHSQVL